MSDLDVDPRRVLVELDDARLDGTEVAVVLSAALTLFEPEVEVLLCLTGVDEPDQGHADRLLQACLASLPPRATMPTIDLLGYAEAKRTARMLHVRAGSSTYDAVRAVVRLGSLAASLRAPELTPGDSTPAACASGGAASSAPSQGSSSHTSLRRIVDERIRARDAAVAGGEDRPMVVAVVQVQSYWPALSSICAALQARADVRLEVVALESEHDVRGQATADFVRDQGYQPRDCAWFESALADPTGSVAVVLFDNPYDAMRPEALRATSLAERGVRTVYSPYTNNNLGSGEHLATQHHDVRAQYDMPLHRLAWRIYVRSEAQRALHARHCTTGDANVRVSGMPKLDRIVTAEPGAASASVLEAAAGRPVVLWNPHFSFGPGGWSTFEQYLQPMLAWFAEHDDVVLLLRPHFRIWRDLRIAAGGRPHLYERQVRDASRRRSNILLDDEVDYLPGFLAADAMMSDLSSLITEFVPLDKPVLYLHREGGPGVNEDASYFYELDVATRWEHVAAFLEQVRLRVDAGAGRRELLLQRHFADLDGRAGGRIADDLIESLAAERASAAA